MLAAHHSEAFMKSISEQLRTNAVALISLVVALSGLSYNTWRNERTEHNRNLRAAGFEVLTKLADFERVVFLAQYDRDPQNGNPRIGWSQVIVLNDLAEVLPPPVAVRAHALRDIWSANWETLGQSDETAVGRIEDAISALRVATLDTLRALH
jgi:hypothetical protein